MLSINIEQSEYYTLQEASEYINIKHKIINTTQRKLLKKIIEYQTPIYVFAKGFGLMGDFETNVLCEGDDPCNSEEKKKHLIDTILSTEDILSTVSVDGILLQLHSDVLKKMPFQDTINTEFDYLDQNLFIGALPLYSLDFNSRTLDYLQDYLGEYYITKVLALVPHFKLNFDEFIEDISEEQEKIISEIKPHVSHWYSMDEPDNEISLFFDFTIQDLIILHKDLTRLESNIIDNILPAPKIESLLKNSDLKPRKGISPLKVEAKKRALSLAKELWSEDISREIKITEMSYKVYTALHITDHKDQLPNHPKSLKAWIVDAAPPYAREAGRPNENNV